MPPVPQSLPTNNERSPNIPPHSEHDSSPQNDAVGEIGNRDQSNHLSPVISNYQEEHESQQSDINRKLLEERDMILEDCNKYKKEITILRAAMEEEHLIRKALYIKIKQLEQDLKESRTECASVRKLNEHIKNTCTPTKSKKSRFNERISQTIPSNLLPFAITVEKELSIWASNETCELCQSNEGATARKWEGRMEIVKLHGIPSSKGFLFVPFLFRNIVAAGDLYISTYDDEESMLEDICKKLLKLEEWEYLKGSEEEQKKLCKSFLPTEIWLLVSSR